MENHKENAVSMRNASIIINDSDLATIKALHDILYDEHGYHFDFIILQKLRKLAAKMNAAIYVKS
jgi:hypothetical protein